MAVFHVGRVGFHKGERSVTDALKKAMDQDTIEINERTAAVDDTTYLHGGITLTGDPNKDAPILVSPKRRPMFVIGAKETGTITLKHLRIQLDESSLGLRVNSTNVRVVFDDVQFYHKQGLDVEYNALVADMQGSGEIDIINSLLDKLAVSTNVLQVRDSNLGDWFSSQNSQLMFKQGNFQGTALQNTLVSGVGDQAQAQLNNCALGGNVRFNGINVAGANIMLTQLPIINHRGKADDTDTSDATALIVGEKANVQFKHVSQGSQQLETKLNLPKWRSIGLLGGSLLISDAYLMQTGLKNVARGGDLTFENVQDDSEWATGNQWGAGPKLHLSNRNSHSSIFDSQSNLNITGSKIYGAGAESPKASQTALQELDQLIGLKPVKSRLKQIISQAKMSAERERRGLGSNSNVRLHMVFAGSAGTGKTTVARLVGRALYENGVLKSTKFIEARATDLVAEHVGETAPKTRAKFQEALDGVLFIDEAYELAPPKGGGNSFNNEAVTELIADMENYRSRVVVIMAGYTQDMKDFFNRGNQGLRSRISNWIEFPDYNPVELKQIERLDLKKAHARLASPQVIELLDRGIDKLLPVVSRSKTTGNGRFVDNYVQKVTEMRDTRLASEENAAKLSNNQLMIIQPQDVRLAVQAMETQMTNMM